MEYVRLGKTGLLVPELALGTMTFGNEADEAVSRQLMDRAFAMGINFFDTACNYNQGATEEIVGRWVGSRRHDLIIASKVFFPYGGNRNDEGLNRRNVVLSVERTLKRLKTDYLDLLYLHHWDENTDIAHTMSAVNQLVQQGKVLYVGVSNFSAWQTMKALETARLNGFPLITVVQPMYSLIKRQVEVEILPMAAEEGLAVVPYNALGAGMLTGKYLQEGAAGRLTQVEMYRQRYDNALYAEVTKKFVDHAKERGLSPAALAVAWVMAHPLVTAPILGARNLEQWEESTQCLDIRLTREEREAISGLSYQPPTATDREPMAAMRARGW
ncbi:MAG: aldo/keto reductase [Candidatus Hydrogenedentota bacterium]